jgi:hypothetical protein
MLPVQTLSQNIGRGGRGMESSQASQTSAEAIKDATNLLARFDKLNTRPPPA